MEFDHIGVPAAAKRDGMRFLESKRLWLTSPRDHPYRVEWLWYEPSSPEAELIRTVPHVAYVSSDGLRDKGDTLHFDAASQRLFGERYARAYLALVAH